MKRSILIFLISSLGLCPVLKAQPEVAPGFKINGKILSTSGNPLAGASLLLKKAATSAVSGDDGSFGIALQAFPDTLVVSLLGYRRVEVPLTAATATPLIVSLQAIISRLEAVTVSTGYQSIPQERATGSFEMIGNEPLNQRVTGNIISRLEDVSSILFDRSSSSSVRPDMTIRGLSTINGIKSPLIILDNFPYEGDINNINPNDVESVTILKDAAAASIWGTRAGNGVIVITTKKGKFSQPLKVELNANATVTQKPDLFYLRQMSVSDFIDVEKFLFSKGYYNNLENNTSSRPPLTPVVETLIAERDGKITEKEAGARIDALRDKDARYDFEKYMYRPAVSRQYSLNMSGGSAKARYYLSGGYERNRDALDARYNRLNFRARNTIRPMKGLELNAGIAYTRSDSYSGKPGYQSFTKLYPYAGLRDKGGKPLPLARYRQSYIDTAGAGYLLDWNYVPLEDYRHDTRHTRINDMVANLGVSYKLLHSLTIDLKYQYERQSSLTKHLQDLESFYTRDLINRFSVIDWNTGKVTHNVPVGAILDRDQDNLEVQNARAQLNYNAEWGRHGLTAIAGAEIREAEAQGNGYRIYGYDEEVLTLSGVDEINAYPDYVHHYNTYIPGNESESAKLNHFVSTYANAAYTYDKKYTLSASARRDASNLFGVNTNDKWQPLWSAGAAWNISGERFYRSSWMPYLKLRATYGYSGNVDQRMSAVTTLRYIGNDQYTNLPYSIINRFENPDLRWEKVRMFNVGLDFSTNNEILTGSVEYYRKKGIDLLGDSPIDYTSGIGMPNLTKNVASMKGSGMDIRIHANILRGKFEWMTDFILSYNTSKVDKYYLKTTAGSKYISNGSTITPIEGKPVFSILSYKWAGLDQEGNPQGVIDGKPSINYASIRGVKTEIADLVYNGPAIPPLYGSFNNSFQWHEMSISVIISYKFGHYFRRKSINYGQLFKGLERHSDYSDRWQKAGDEKVTNVPSLIYPDNSGRDAFYDASEVLIDKGDNVRLQCINLGYNIKWKGCPLARVKVYLNITNPGIIWKSNKDAIDPDYADSFSPPSKSFSIGVRSTF